MTVSEYRKKIDEAARFLADGLDLRPTVGIILGTGLGGLVEEIEQHPVVEGQRAAGEALPGVDHHP